MLHRGHCTSASEMKQRTWTHDFKKQTQETQTTGGPATRWSLFLLPIPDVGFQARGIHRALWDFTWAGKAVSMHCRASQGSMRWRRGYCAEHRGCLPLLQHGATQGEAPSGRSQTCFRRAFKDCERQMAPAASENVFHRTKSCP